MTRCKHGMDLRFCSNCTTPPSDHDPRRQSIQCRAVQRAPVTSAEREALLPERQPDYTPGGNISGQDVRISRNRSACIFTLSGLSPCDQSGHEN